MKIEAYNQTNRLKKDYKLERTIMLPNKFKYGDISHYHDQNNSGRILNIRINGMDHHILLRLYDKITVDGTEYDLNTDDRIKTAEKVATYIVEYINRNYMLGDPTASGKPNLRALES